MTINANKLIYWPKKSKDTTNSTNDFAVITYYFFRYIKFSCSFPLANCSAKITF